MKNMKKILLSFFIVLSMALIMPIVIPGLQNISTVEAASVKINKKKLTLNVKENYKLKVKGTSSKIKWSTSNKKIATVSSKGKVKAKKKGKVTITAKVKGKKYKCKIKVEKPSLNKTTTKIALNQKEKLIVTGTTQKIKWSSQNKKIATVNSKGKITPKKVGTTKIVAKIGNTKYKCKVKVVKESYKSNIKLSYNKVNEDILITIKNNNSCKIDYVGISINFYKNNNLVKHNYTNQVCIVKNGTAYAETHVPTEKKSDGKYGEIDYDRIELVVEDANVYNNAFSYVDMKNKLTVKHSKQNGKVVGTITNNSDDGILTTELLALYYKNGKLVGWSNHYINSLEDNSTKTFEFLKYFNSKTLKYEEFDTYSLIINRATK